MSAFGSGVHSIFRGLVLGDVSHNCKPVVIGIDFGTAYSGVSFAFAADPGTIQCGAPTATDAMQMKVPTTLLQLEDGTWKFGYVAEEKYNEILLNHAASEEPDAPLTAHLYSRYKMVLKDKESGFDTLTAMSIKGRSHSLMDLTVRTLQFLENFAITKVSGGFGGTVNPLRDVQWVLTVPAIWNDFGKAFMRKAAFKAGLIEEEQSDNLLLVLEPEGASLAVHVGAAQHGLLGAGSRFMVLDCGGGTVDITVHQVLTVQPLTMKAVAAPTGGDWGGDYVNMEFKKFLAELLGPDLFKEQDLPLEFYSIYRDFDKIKVVYDAEVDPPAIRVVDVLDNKKQLVELAAAYNSKHPDKPILNTAPQRNGFLTMSKELMLSFFEPSLRATVQATRTVLAETPGIRHIIVVGGFGSSKVLTTRVCSEFHNRGGVVVVLPASHPKPQGAIVQGAVYFGLHKDIMQSRVAAHTYGVAMRDPENTSDIFSVLVRKGEALPFDHTVTISALPLESTQTAVSWRIYRSNQEAPATPAGEHCLGQLIVNCPLDPDRSRRKQRGVFSFGGSEIRVLIVNGAGDEFRGEITME